MITEKKRAKVDVEKRARLPLKKKYIRDMEG